VLGACAPGKSGLIFDHILKKSRETGAELHSLTGAMDDIHNTLGISLVSHQLFIFQHWLIMMLVATDLLLYRSSLSPVWPQDQDLSKLSMSPPALLAELQSQLHETQSSLATPADKARMLETVIAEYEAIKREVGALRQLVEKRSGT